MIGQTISHYKILEKLGEGGMGVVYKAEDTKLKRIVALKFLPPELTRDPEAKARFIREAQAASALEHPNICNIHEINETEPAPGEPGDGQMYMVMACYEGETLKLKIEKGKLKIEDAIDYSTQITEGLARAHEEGIVHRDIKPANIIVTDRGEVKILDFGLAKLAGQNMLTKTGTTMGTINYMSPEQARGEKVDHRTDIWSLGVVLYEMITGQTPFKGEYDQAVVYSILNEEPEPISSLGSDIPAELWQVVQKTMQKETHKRPANMDELLKELKLIKKKLAAELAESPTSKQQLLPSIAVLPFANMSADPEQEFFCDGMSEEIINALTHIENLHVVARTSAFAFKGQDVDIREIGHKLNVEHVLEGSVRKAGNRLRITIQLVNVADGYHLWSERYDRDMEDVFAIQDEISLGIVHKLKGKLLREEKEKLVKQPIEDLVAYNLYLKGRYFYNKSTPEDLNKAIEYFEQAIERTPDFTHAYVGLSVAYTLLCIYDYLHSEDGFPKAKEAALKAVEIDETFAGAHISLGLVKLCYDWDWDGAEKEYMKASELNPNHERVHLQYAGYFSVIGKLDEAIMESRKALELDPLSIIVYNALGMYLLRANQLQQAKEQFQKTLELVPNHPVSLFVLGQVYVLETRYEKGIAEIQKAFKLSGKNAMTLTALGWAYAVSGQKKEARKVLVELKKKSEQEYVRPFSFAKIHSALGEINQAFQWLDKAYEEHDISLIHIMTDETIENLRSDQRYNELLKKMNLNK